MSLGQERLEDCGREGQVKHRGNKRGNTGKEERMPRPRSDSKNGEGKSECSDGSDESEEFCQGLQTLWYT